ncbi:MAG: DUF4838 domain-containing protein [Lentisphaerae bacterium]|nr:DUF4838 domain-containing protein [Lentisphaerota bacterium]MBT4822306.1 DUF4838 domain-containing protein [Lentisphaerota bacterium]MBT5606825.1 DUF4838 domain-containing protein [Lentisphaerota bacterium]MBT7055767.1 DUF4838 domain-containing protein [Lentisphaerota bacterium]MBT7843098.1 DUF4838 domain-containing protein [Lentisphaerota bacterium]
MNNRKRLLWTVVLAVANATLAGTTIVVDLGDHSTAKAAGNSEATVNWQNADKTDDVVCTQSFAALELQRALRKITGRAADFAIVDDQAEPSGDLVLLGGSATNAITKRLAGELAVPPDKLGGQGPEGYRLKTITVDSCQVTVIAGGGRVGTLYGVYDLLHRLGCRWFAPGETNEELPDLELTSFPPLDVTEMPKFFTRGFHAWENRADTDFLMWMARNRCNYWCVQQENHPLLRKLGIMLVCGGHHIMPWYLHPNHTYPYNHAAFAGDETHPRDPYAAGDQCEGDTNENGKLSYFEAHPEWFPLVKGERIPGYTGEFGVNYCTSNNDATDELMKRAVKDLIDGKFRDADIVRFWSLDAGKWCECASCKALGTPTDRTLLWVHRFAQEVKKAQAAQLINRKIVIRFLAYADVLRPPTRPLPEDFNYSMCSATYFPIVRCYVHNFDDPTCSKNAQYVKHLHGWAVDPERHYKGEICIGEYYNVSGYKCLPVCFMHTMANDIPYYYHGSGARHFHYMHCTTGNWGNKALTNYQMARQLWDPDLDCEPLWEDYFRVRYGRAATSMRRFYETLEQMLCNVSELKYGLARRLERGAGKLFPNAHLHYEKTSSETNDGPDLVEMLGSAETCRAIIDRVRGGPLTPRIAARVEEDGRLFTYGERTLHYYDACARAYSAIRQDSKEAAREALAQAKRVADLLREDTTSTTLASAHANSPNAFTATYAAGALAVLQDLIGPIVPDDVKTFDVEAQKLVLIGRDFSGGGALKYGYHLHVFPERRKVSDDGNFIYGKGTRPYDRMTAWFRMPDVSAAPLFFRPVGLSYPEHGDSGVAGRILVNGLQVFAGDVPLPTTALGAFEFMVPAGVFKKGLNRLDIRNVEPEGRVGNRPWFGIDRIEMRTKPMAKEPLCKTLETPVDLALSYRSEVDGTAQPYRVYLPSTYDGTKRLPLFIALHGTGGSQDTYFDTPNYGDGIYKREAEKRGIVAVCPHGRGTTEYRGIGENDVLAVVEEVCKQFLIDPDRIICSGQSMGGTGTTYLCCRYPDVFAAGIPLASTYGHLALVENLRHVPMFYVQGAKDWPVYAKDGPIPITKHMEELGYDGTLWVVPDQPHNTMTASTERVLDWALGQRLIRRPERVTFRTFLPIHGKAYWTEIQEITEIGPPARIDACIQNGNTISATIHNATRVALRPEPELLDLAGPIRVVVNEKEAFNSVCPAEQEIRLVYADGGWKGSVGPRALRPLTAYRTHRIGIVGEPPTQEGSAETSMGSWLADAFRDVAGTDLAIYTGRHSRGVPFKQGQDVFLVDLVNWLRPFNRVLSTFEITGRDLLEIIEDNVRKDSKFSQHLIQVSGCRYAFDKSKPKGERVVETDLDPERTYRVVCEQHHLSRGDTMFLAGRSGKIPYTDLETTNLTAAWRAIVEAGGRLHGKRDGRVRDLPQTRP